MDRSYFEQPLTRERSLGWENKRTRRVVIRIKILRKPDRNPVPAATGQLVTAPLRPLLVTETESEANSLASPADTLRDSWGRNA